MNKNSYFLLIAVAALGILTLYYTFRPTTETVPAETTNSTEQAESSTSVYLSALTDLKGNTISMDSDKLIFLNVWATWCGPCNMEMPGIQSLYEKYKSNKKIAFYIVSDEDASIVTPFIQRKGYQLPFYQYTGVFPAALDGNAIPRSYLILNGKIISQEIGASQWDSPEKIDLIERQLQQI